MSLENPLLLNEETIRIILNTTLEGFLLQDLNGKLLDVNDSACKIFGYSKQELLSMYIFQLDAVAQKEDILKIFEVLKIQKHITFETLGKKKDGSIFNLEINATYSEKIEGGCTFSFIRDITERKNETKKLREIEEKFIKITQNFPSSIIQILDKNYNITYLAGDLVKTLGFDPEIAIGKNIKEYLPEENFKEIKSIYDKCFSGENIQFEYPFLDRTVLVVASPILDLNNNVSEVLIIGTDITERKNIENSIKSSQIFLDNLINAIPNILIVKNRNHQIVQINKTGCEFFNKNKEEIIGKTDFDLLEYETAKLNYEIDDKVFNTKEKFEYEIIFKIGNFERIRLSYFKDNTGDYIIVFSKDITERKEAEKELISSKLFLNNLINAIPNPLLVKNKKHQIVHVNPAGCEFSKMPLEKLLWKMDFEYLPPEIAQKNIDADNEVFETKSKNSYENRYLFNGIEKYGLVQKSYFSDDKDEYIILFVTDITERKLSEEALQKTLQRLTDIQNAIEKFDIISMSDMKGNITYVNDKFCEMTQYSREELIGSHYSKMYTEHHSEELMNDLVFTTMNGKPWHGEMKNLKKDGTFYWVNTTLIPFLDEHGIPIECLIIEHDITEIKNYSDNLKKAKEEADQANLSKSHFLANVSHEIRSPLNAIVGFSQILIQKSLTINALPDEYKNYLINIKTAGQNLAELINNILDLSKIEAGKMTISLEVLNLKQLFLSVIHINKPMALDKEIQFNYFFDSKLPDFVMSDRTKINQILMNLISNAIKFTNPNQRIEIKASKDNDNILFQVIDTGIGISSEQQKIIFQPFVQADSSITRKFGGTGLGLSITKQIVELLKGTISIESELNKGSIFSVRIPLLNIEKNEVNDTVLMIEEFQFSSENKILMVEDNKVNIEMMKALFELLDLELIVAENGKEGIEKIERLNFDLVLMDLHMPVMDGFEATKHIRSISKYNYLPIVALTADTLSDNEKTALSIGFNEILTKPLDFHKLLHSISKYLKKVEMKNERLNKQKLPDEIHLKIIDELKILQSIPFIKSIKVMDHIESIRLICKPYDTHYKLILDTIEDSLFKGNEEQYLNVLHDLRYE